MEGTMASVLFLVLLFLPLFSFSRDGSNGRGVALNGEATSDQLLHYDEAMRKVVLHEDILDKLTSLSGPLHVITAIGDARIGKSTAFNVMAAMFTTKDKKGKISSVPSLFNVCQSLETCTKGVWMHTLPLHDGGHLVMLDVEGTDLGGDMITTQFSLLTSLLSSNILVFLKESFPKRTSIFLHELARLKDRLRAHTSQVPADQALYIIIRDPLKPPQDVSLKTYVTQVLTDPTFCIDGLDECKLLEKNFPLNQVNVYSMPYVSRRHQKTFEWALKDKTYLRTVASLAFDIKTRIELSLGSETNGGVFSGIVRTFIQTLVHSTPSTKSSVGDTCEPGAKDCESESTTSTLIELKNQGPDTQELEILSVETNQEIDDQDKSLPQAEDPEKTGSIDVEKIIKSPFETMGPGVYSFVMNNVLRIKPTPVVSKQKKSKEDDDEEEEGETDDDSSCKDSEKGCGRNRSSHDTLSKWSKAVREFIDDISDALDDFFSSVLSE